MNVTTENAFHAFLSGHNQRSWNQLVSKLVPSIHPVDQIATQIWFCFWPLKLCLALKQSTDLGQTVRELELDGNYRLEAQLDLSVNFVYGSRYWSEVKKAILAHCETCVIRSGSGLEQHIRETASQLAAVHRLPDSLLLGITAIGFMTLQQIGLASFAARANTSVEDPMHTGLTPERVLGLRARETRPGLLGFLRTTDRKYTVTFKEGKPDCSFEAIRAQDISMASATDEREYKSKDARCVAGPVPAQCRSAACGYCWVGILTGRDKLCEISEFERKRLKHFGYISSDLDNETHPHIRLACQAKCYGDVTVVLPSWNGVLSGRD